MTQAPELSADPYQTLTIDGQSMVMPLAAQWPALLAQRALEGVALCSANTQALLIQMVSCAADHPATFRVGLFLAGRSHSSWTAVLLCLHSDAWQRVHLEFVQCPTCAWRGAAANPTEPSLYFGNADAQMLLRRAWQLPRVPCPRCKTELPRPAIWVDSTFSEFSHG